MSEKSEKENEQAASSGLDDPPCSLPHQVQSCFVFAARYAHHRNTGAALATVRGLELVWHQLSESTREQIIRETEEATVNLSDWLRLREFANNEKAWKECPLDSISTAIAFTPLDWSTHHRMAWIYGIACGWDEESLAELTEKHGWKPDTVERLKRLRAKWESLEAND